MSAHPSFDLQLFWQNHRLHLCMWLQTCTDTTKEQASNKSCSLQPVPWICDYNVWSQKPIITLYGLIVVLDTDIMVTAVSYKSLLLFFAYILPCFSGGTGLGWADLGWLGVQRVGWVSTVEAGALTLLSWWQAVNLILVSTNSHPERFSNLIEGNSIVNATFRFEKY